VLAAALIRLPIQRKNSEREECLLLLMEFGAKTLTEYKRLFHALHFTRKMKGF
jgi:hypothetical protein